MGDIFLKLLNMSITAGWLILVVLGIRLLFRKIPKWIHCLLWGVVAIRLIFPFSIESEFSLQPSAEPIKSSTMVEGQVVPYVPSIDSNLQIVDNAVNPLLAETFAYQEAESVAPLQVLTAVSGNIWLCGMAGLLIFALVSMIKLRLSVREAVLYKENIYICDAVKSPFILGIVKPRIYLSSALSEEEMDYIIAHEMAHLKRKDHLWKPFGYLLLCIYWFNPLCWIAYIMLCKDIELACDEKVIKNMSFGKKKEYSGVLLSCASQRRLVSVCPLAFGEVGVKERVKSVLNYKRPAFWITITAIIGCIIVAICFLTNPHKEYSIRITIPAGSTEEIIYQEDFCYSDAEISPTGHQIILSLGEGAGDTEIVLKPIEVKEENAYEPTYITPGMPVKMDVEKGAWFKIGVNMQNPTTEDITVYVSVRNVEVRIASDENAESSRPVHFSDGEDSSENKSFESERDYDAQASETTMEDLQSELERVVGDIGLEHAYPWNNTVELKSDADALIKMACDDTGRFEIYGIMSAKYGTFGLLLNDWIGGEQNWNFELVPWYYSGAPSDQPILESDGNGKYIFAYVYQYEDGVPLWRECILDCGYDTGHMELISPENSIVSAIVVTNGNTGEEITLSADSAAYKELLKLYRQLDFKVEYEENTRIGYQYKMKLLDADGNILQIVTPYKDGVTVGGIFFKYDNTGKDAVPSLSLMEYLEYLCNSEQEDESNTISEQERNIEVSISEGKSFGFSYRLYNLILHICVRCNSRYNGCYNCCDYCK